MSQDKAYLPPTLPPHFTDEMYVADTVFEIKF